AQDYAAAVLARADGGEHRQRGGSGRARGADRGACGQSRLGQRRRGRSIAAIAATIAASSKTPITIGATDLHTSAPPGTAKVRPSSTTPTTTAISSHGTPRRCRP